MRTRLIIASSTAFLFLLLSFAFSDSTAEGSDSKEEKRCCPCITATDVGKCAMATGGIFGFLALLGFGAAGIGVGTAAALMMSVAAKMGFGMTVVSVLQYFGASIGAAALWAKVFAVCQGVFIATSTVRGDCCECPFEMKL